MKPKSLAGVINDTHLCEERIELVVDIFKQFLTYLVSKNIKYAFHLGDWFHKRAGTSLLCQLATKEIISSFEANEIQLICIPGNHDKTDYTSHLSYLHTYDFVSVDFENWEATYYPLLIEEPFCFNLREAPQLLLNFIPYFREDIYPAKLKQLENQDLNNNQKNILFTHVGINGARNNDGSIVTNGVTTELFKQFECTYSGHYHNRSVINAAKAYYIGSAYQRDFGEDAYKGFNILYDNGNLEFQKTEFKEYCKFEVESVDKNKLRSILKEINRQLQDNNYVRIIFTGAEDELNSIDVNSFRKLGVDVKFKNTKELRVDFDDIDEADFHVFDKKDILKNYLEYTKQYKFTGSQRSQGFNFISNA